MDAKEKLSEAWYCQQQIEAKLNDIERLRSLAEKCTTSFSLAPINGGTGERIPDAVTRIMEIEKEVSDSIEELKTARTNVEQYINDNFPPGVTRVLLYRRYILMQRWELIAMEMCYSVKWIWKLHGRALAELNARTNSESVNGVPRIIYVVEKGA